MQLSEAYPTVQHANAARNILGLFSSNHPIDAILLTNSCARGHATRDSCLDMVVLVNNETMQVQRTALEKEWQEFRENSPSIRALQGRTGLNLDMVFLTLNPLNVPKIFVFPLCSLVTFVFNFFSLRSWRLTFYLSALKIRALREVGMYSEVHLDFIDGVFTPVEQEEGGGQDPFELEIGNYLVYGLPLWQSGDYLGSLKRKWLPYYDDQLRTHRLGMVRRSCLNNLQHIPLYVKRGLYFQSFDRLYNAYRELLQAVFIHRRTYPLAYNKWIREQVEEILGLPQLYEVLSHLFEISTFESSELEQKAEVVGKLLDEYAPALE